MSSLFSHVIVTNKQFRSPSTPFMPMPATDSYKEKIPNQISSGVNAPTG